MGGGLWQRKGWEMLLPGASVSAGELTRRIGVYLNIAVMSSAVPTSAFASNLLG